MTLRRQPWSIYSAAWLAVCASVACTVHAQHRASSPELTAPIAVYLHEPASAEPALSEDRALHDLDQLARLKKSGLRVDYDLLDASVLAPSIVAPAGLAPAGPAAAWPNGPDRWIAQCRAAGIGPGLRFAALALRPALSGGQSLPSFISALESWYGRGIRLFVFNGLDPLQEPALAPNAAALSDALTRFRGQNRGVVLLDIESAPTDSAPENHSSPNDPPSRPLNGNAPAFVLFSTSAPHPSHWPQPGIQRAIDVETDSQVRRVEQTGVALAHIVSPPFTAGAPHLPRAWKSRFLLSMARGGRVHPLSGALDSIQTADARWMASVERLFFALQAKGQMRSFGASPFQDQPYGFAAATPRGAVYVVVNPSQAVATLSLPVLVPGRSSAPGRLLFRDAGFSPRLLANAITLGPGQLAAVGYGAYASASHALGAELDVVIPTSIEPVDADFQLTAPGVLEARIDPPIQGVLRIVVRAGDDPSAVTPNPPPAHRFTFEVTQADRPIPLREPGPAAQDEDPSAAEPAWAIAEVDVNDLTPGIPLRVLVRTDENTAAALQGGAYQVTY